jgi:hypothetical protein
VTEFFGSVRGALSVYCSSDEGQLTDARFVLARFGEDQDKVVAAFFHEHSDARFSIVPLFAYGSPPRKELCTKQSLTAALKSAKSSLTERSNKPGKKPAYCTKCR